MNNNQDSFNSQNNNINQNMNSDVSNNNQNRFIQQPMLNVIPGMQQNSNDINQPLINNNNGNLNQTSGNIVDNLNTFNNQPIQPTMPTINNNNNSILNDEIKIESNNRFINNNIESNNNLTALNIEDKYNNKAEIYLNDPKVQANLRENLNQEENKKNTITITGEGKVFLVIIAALLVFTFVMPYIFDLIRDIKY